MISIGNYVINSEKTFPDNTHNLVGLWTTLNEDIIPEIKEDITVQVEDFKIMGKLLNELNSIDPVSDSTRFPYSKKGEAFRLNRAFDINRLETSFTKMINFLDHYYEEFKCLESITENYDGYYNNPENH